MINQIKKCVCMVVILLPCIAMYSQIADASDGSAIAKASIDKKLITPNASPEAKNLYNYLLENYGEKTISGTMANYSTGMEEANWVHDLTGKWVGLTAFDFIDYTRQWHFVDYNAIVNNSKEWWANNGIVSIAWHWRDPSRATEQFYTDSVTFDVSKISDVNSVEYAQMLEDIDEVAKYVIQLRDLDIPILWRPLHEAAGGWFWWGAKGAKPCKELWYLMYNRLVNHHKLNNLIWVWTSDAEDSAPEWYPGHDFVDMVGMDIYPGENNHESQYIKFNKVKAFTEERKMLTLSECGSIPEIDLMFAKGDIWSWFMPWNGPMIREDIHNGKDFIKKTISNPKVITRDQMPDLSK